MVKMNGKDVLIQYVRDKRNQPIGTLMAVKVNPTLVKIGYSLCNTSEGDHVSKEKGKLIAYNRALSDKAITVPETLKKTMDKFILRAGNYFYPETKEEN